MAFSILGLAGLLGLGSQLLFAVFLYAGSLDLLGPRLEGAGALAWDALLCLAFFLQHSGMRRKAFRRLLEKVVPPTYQGVLYTIASGVVLLALLLLWQRSPGEVLILHGPVRWLARAAFFAFIAGIVWSSRSLGSFDTFGFRPILYRLRGKALPAPRLIVRGPYRWVRHPIYLFSILMIWSTPDLTADRLLFNALWTVWILIGTWLEERDLAAELGEAYRKYQREVPMLVPLRVRNAGRWK
jgi:protein-S-isoprenylcysteine O-methyltransferase Ste14